MADLRCAHSFILMVLYVLIALVIWFYPGSAENLTAVELS